MAKMDSNPNLSPQENMEMYQAIFEATGTATIIVNENTSIAMANHECARLTGYTPKELVGQSWTSFVALESLDIMQRYHKTRRGDTSAAPKKYEVKLINKKGDVRNAMLDVNIITGSKQSVVSMLDITALRAAENTALNNEIKSHAILDAIPDFMFQIDKDGIVKNYKGDKESLYTSPDKFLGKNIQTVVPPDLAQLTMNNLNAVLQTKQMKVYDYQLQINGELRHFESRMVICGKNEVLAIVRDITEQKRSADIVKENESRLNAMISTIDEAVFEFDKNGTYLNIWATNEKMLAAPKHEMLGKTITQVLKNGRGTDFLNIIKRVIQTGQSENVEYQLNVLGGEYWFSGRINPIITSDGDIKTASFIIRDITDRKQTELALQESEERFSAFMETLPITAFIKDPDHKCLYVNQEMKKVFDTENWIGKTIFEIFPPEIAQSLEESDEKSLQKGYGVDIHTVPDKSGNERIWETHVFRIDRKDRRPLLGGFSMDITGRKRQEDEYQKLFITVEQSPISIVITDINGKIEYVNPQFSKITGYRAEEVVGKNPSILKTGHTKAEEYSTLWETIKKGNVWRGEFLNKHKNGDFYWEDATIGPIKDKNGNTTHFVGLKVDISPRKKALDELHRIHDIYRNAIENTNGVPYQLSYNRYNYDFVGSGIESLLGIDSTEFSPQKMISMIETQIVTDPETFTHNPQIYARAFREGKIKPYQMDINVTLDTGEKKWISDYSTPLIDDKTGGIIGSLGILQDITDRKLVESELQFRLQLEEIVSAISTIFINIDITNIDSGIDKALQMIGRFIGVDRSNVFQLNDNGTIMKLTHEWCAEKSLTQKENQQKLSTENYPWLMSQLKQKDHIYFPTIAEMPAAANAEIIALKAQEIRSIIIIPIIYGEKLMGFLDLDALSEEMAWTQKDIALLQTIGDIFANALEHFREENDKQNIQHQLLQSQKMEAIGTLSGGIAHDFNNLLTVIQGHAQLMMMNMDESTHQYRELKQIINATTRAANLTRQLLLFSRKQAMEFIPININQTITNLLKMIKRLIGENISITTKLETEAWTIEADEGNLEQVLMNISVNARDAMPQGGNLTIQTKNYEITKEDCKLRPDSYPGRFVRIIIEDTGTGIAPSILKNIFEPFFSTKEVGKGTGLGLSVVYGIVKKHNGWINVYSEMGKGSNFKIYIPATDQTINTVTMEKGNLKTLHGNGERILLIEDEEGVREFTAAALRQYNYTVFEAPNAATTQKIFTEESGRFDLIISDVVLPDGNGYSLMEELLGENPGISVIMCSGYSEENIQQSIRENKKFLYIQKPFKLLDLYQTIYCILTQKK